jgi:hypothetical protein
MRKKNICEFYALLTPLQRNKLLELLNFEHSVWYHLKHEAELPKYHAGMLPFVSCATVSQALRSSIWPALIVGGNIVSVRKKWAKWQKGKQRRIKGEEKAKG